MLSIDDIARLRDALTAADFTDQGIAGRLGPDAVAAIGRGDHRAALRATADRDPLATLIRLFVCQQVEPAPAVRAALAPLDLDEAVAGGIVTDAAGCLRQGVDLQPYGDRWWIVADPPAWTHRGGPLPANHVLGLGGASATLAAATIRAPVRTALDLGAGCGVQALRLGAHAERVTATDLSRRALRFAATTAALSGQSWELLHGDLAAPVAGRRFDLVVSNPPFVVGPGRATHTYRDSGRAGDAICAELAAAAPSLLTEGGTMQFLANWAHVRGQDWRERVSGWVTGTGVDAWIIQREVSDPASYVRLWLADAGEPADPQRMADWLDWCDAQGIEGIGFGLVSLRRTDSAAPVVRAEELRQQVAGELGGHVAAWFDRQRWLRSHDSGALLATRFRAADGLKLRQEARRENGDWAVTRQVLALTDGLRWQEEVDPVALAVVSGCDGDASLGEQLTVLAAAYETPAWQLGAMVTPLVARLVERGLLVPAAG
ncbi:methyltransferase [Pilimelia columellifera subsp. columellifera]|uniref:Methyltransferase n=1 Tax=Pilimelia columellifera subsp. columellifera TaxID=706583 RepID=A0ABN3N3V9_9ACTN